MTEELQGPLRQLDGGTYVGCRAGACPTVYATERDTVVVQGYSINPDAVGLALPDGENAVEIPIALLRAAASQLSG
jgi:hypothetical protein